jgi:hypothetical protein
MVFKQTGCGDVDSMHARSGSVEVAELTEKLHAGEFAMELDEQLSDYMKQFPMELDEQLRDHMEQSFPWN